MYVWVYIMSDWEKKAEARMADWKAKKMADWKAIQEKALQDGLKGGIRPAPRYDCSHPPPNVRMACGTTGPRYPVPGGPVVKYKKGGRVKCTCKAIVHKGEYILPKGVKPTKAQVKKVNAMKKRK